jgi:Fur family peroxide stress response transcriptional regulator
MKTSPAEVKLRLNYFEEACRKAGFKVTHQRKEIFKEVARSIDHPDAEAVYKSVRRRIPSVSQDTVYRTLRMLTDLEMINVLGASKDRIRFDANLEQHHHFVCSKCGLTRDFVSADLNNIKVPDLVKDMGAVRLVQVEVRGVCQSCLEKEKTNK